MEAVEVALQDLIVLHMQMEVQVLKAVTEERVIKTLAAEHNVLAAAVAVWVVLATMVHQVLEVTEDQE